jgi:hypothetical protein
MKTYVHLCLAEFFLEWETFQTSFRENQNTHFVFNNVFPKICRLWDNVEKMVQPDRPQMAI